MNPTVHIEPRPEAMADVPGVCELPLTRAIVQYRDVHEIEMAGGRIQDIGIALVLEGRYASSAEALDLGSTDVKILDLSAQLVVLDWAYEPTLKHALSLLSASRQQPERQRDLERFAFRLGLGLLERVGFGPLTRPTFLRVGFRDICRDLDLHEGTSVRVIMGPGRVVRAHLDYDSNALIFRTATTERDGALEEALELAFAKGELRRLVPPSSFASGGYQVRLPLPLSFAELRQELRRIRFGLDSLIARFEPERHQNLTRLLSAFGRRETLARLRLEDPHASVALDRNAAAGHPKTSADADAPGPSTGDVFGSGHVH